MGMRSLHPAVLPFVARAALLRMCMLDVGPFPRMMECGCVPCTEALVFWKCGTCRTGRLGVLVWV